MSILTASGAVGLGAAASLGRQQGAPALDTVWAEDGGVFLQDALRAPAFTTVADPYEGYIHVVPRLLAEVAATLPLDHAAQVFAAGSASVVGALGVLVYRITAGHLRTTAIRLVLSAALVLLPIAGLETANNAANLHWYFMFASFWVLLWRPQHPVALTVGSVILFLTALSDPLTGLLLPVAVARFAVLRPWRDRIFCACLAVGLLGQIAAVALGAGSRDFALLLNPAKAVGWYASSVLAPAVFGVQLVGGSAIGSAPVGPRLVIFTAFGGLLMLGCVVLALRCAPATQTKVLAATSAAASLLFFLAPVILGGFTTSRYAVVPALLLLVAAAALLDGYPSSGNLRVWRTVRMLALVLVLVVWVLDYRQENSRSAGPTWSATYKRADAACARADADAQVEVRIPPQEWTVTLPCRAVLR